MTVRLPASAPGRLPNGIIGVILLVALEIMLFTGLIGAYLVARLSAARWPPMNAPRLDAVSGGIATAVIVLSNLLLAVAGRLTRDRAGARSRLVHGLIALALLFGTVFSVMQALEWRAFVFAPDALRGYGVDLSPAPAGGFFALLHWHLGRSTYGAYFFTLTMLHGLHLWIGMAWLAVLVLRGRLWAASGLLGTQLEMAAWYWHFVGAMWLALYYLLYIAR